MTKQCDSPYVNVGIFEKICRVGDRSKHCDFVELPAVNTYRRQLISHQLLLSRSVSVTACIYSNISCAICNTVKDEPEQLTTHV